MSYIQIILVLIVLSGWLVSLALHEFSHALVAYHGGDTSVVDKVSIDNINYLLPIWELESYTPL